MRLTDEPDLARLSKYNATLAGIAKIVDKTRNKYIPAQLAKEDLANILYSMIG